MPIDANWLRILAKVAPVALGPRQHFKKCLACSVRTRTMLHEKSFETSSSKELASSDEEEEDVMLGLVDAAAAVEVGSEVVEAEKLLLTYFILLLLIGANVPKDLGGRMIEIGKNSEKENENIYEIMSRIIEVKFIITIPGHNFKWDGNYCCEIRSKEKERNYLWV